MKKDIDIARRYYMQSAERGNAKAMHNLAVLDADGGGKGANYKSAAQWFRKAADRGVADSQYNLGILYARGIGVDQNLAESFKWFSLAAAQGDADLKAASATTLPSGSTPQSLAAAKLAIQTFTAGAAARRFRHCGEPGRRLGQCADPGNHGQAGGKARRLQARRSARAHHRAIFFFFFFKKKKKKKRGKGGGCQPGPSDESYVGIAGVGEPFRRSQYLHRRAGPVSRSAVNRPGSDLRVDDRQQRNSGLPVPPVRPKRDRGTGLAKRRGTGRRLPAPHDRPLAPDGLPVSSARNLISVVNLHAAQRRRFSSRPGATCRVPDAFDYWKDLYSTPSMTSSVVECMSSSTAGARTARSCGGKIGARSRELVPRESGTRPSSSPGDLVLMSSPGGDLGQSVIMGEFIRAHGLVTAVGTADASGQVRPGSRASACVFVYAGGAVRYDVAGLAHWGCIAIHDATGPAATIPSPIPSG